jgi:hypothetical protein
MKADPKPVDHLRAAMGITVPVARHLPADLVALGAPVDHRRRTDPADHRRAGRKAEMDRANSNHACVRWAHRPSR